jgi:hypothetical protein
MIYSELPVFKIAYDLNIDLLTRAQALAWVLVFKSTLILVTNSL